MANTSEVPRKIIGLPPNKSYWYTKGTDPTVPPPEIYIVLTLKVPAVVPKVGLAV
jgi:hypothetical protein